MNLKYRFLRVFYDLGLNYNQEDFERRGFSPKPFFFNHDPSIQIGFDVKVSDLLFVKYLVVIIVGNIKMIEKLKYLIDVNENKPKIKDILLKIAKMPEDKQEDTLKLIELLIKSKEE